METLQNRTTEPGLVRMEVSRMKQSEKRVCDEHGEYLSTKYPTGWASCPDCMKVKIERQNAEHVRQIETDRIAARAAALLGKAAIPRRFSDRRLSTFVADLPGQKKALAVANAYVENFDKASGQSLILCGGVGAGKTHISVGIAHELIAKQCVCVFTSVIGAIRSVKETYSRDSDINEREALENLIEPDLLILDEVGVQFGSETEKLILFEIINGRYENMKSTIVISNLAMAELEKYLGERVVDRLREGGGRAVLFDWPSHRRLAA